MSETLSLFILIFIVNADAFKLVEETCHGKDLSLDHDRQINRIGVDVKTPMVSLLEITEDLSVPQSPNRREASLARVSGNRIWGT